MKPMLYWGLLVNLFGGFRFRRPMAERWTRPKKRLSITNPKRRYRSWRLRSNRSRPTPKPDCGWRSGMNKPGNFDHAIDTLQDMVTQGLGDQAVVLGDLGGNYARKGDDAKAIEYFTKSIAARVDYT